MRNNRTTTSRKASRRAKIRIPRTKHFTISDVIDENWALSPQTVRLHVKALMETARLVKVGTVETGAPGRPSYILRRRN